MELQTVRVKIGPDGKVELTVEGAPGDKCLVITKDLEKALGGDIVSREMTADFYKDVEEAEKLNVQT